MQYAFHVTKIKKEKDINAALKEIQSSFLEHKKIKTIVRPPKKSKDIISTINNLPYYQKGKNIRKNGVLVVYIKNALDSESYHKLDKDKKDALFDSIRLWFIKNFCDDYVMSHYGSNIRGLIVDESSATVYAFIIPVADGLKLNAKHYINGPQTIYTLKNSFFTDVLSPFDLKYKTIKNIAQDKKEKILNFSELPERGDASDEEYCEKLQNYIRELQLENRRIEKEYKRAFKTVQSIKYAIGHMPDREKAENIRNTMNEAIRFTAANAS